MLTVARRLRPDIEWREGDAAALPFPDEAFDAVLCQAALMFFPDVPKALREMRRVAAAEGTVGVQVWGSLNTQPGYGPFVDVAARHAGPEAISLLGAYWALGDLDRLATLFDAAGLVIDETRTHMGTARFESIDAMVRTEVEGSPLVDRLSDETYSRIVADSRKSPRALLHRYRPLESAHRGPRDHRPQALSEATTDPTASVDTSALLLTRPRACGIGRGSGPGHPAS
jgi:SAM-dependent methyltransferase